jgi:hypothetical protein
MPAYYLVDDGSSMPRWCELGIDGAGSFWIDFKARRKPYAEARPLAVVEAPNDRALLAAIPREIAQLERDYALRFLLDPWSDQGWITPAGRFYGCRFYAHDDIAYALLHRTVQELAGEGWVRVHADSYRTSEYFGRTVTPAQEKTLRALGFPEPGEIGVRRRWSEPDRNGPPPRYAYAPARSRPTEPRTASPRPARGGAGERALRDLVARLAADPFFLPLSGEEPRLIARVGPGRWMWMLEFDDVHVGSPEPPDLLAASPGLYVSAPATDQLELEAWPDPGVEACPDARRIMERQAAAMRGPTP